MSTTSEPEQDQRDRLAALSFVQEHFARWHQRGTIRTPQYETLRQHYDTLRQDLDAGQDIRGRLALRSVDECWSCRESVASQASHCDACGAPVHTTETDRLRYLITLCQEIRKQEKAGRLSLSAAHVCLGEANGQVVALRRALDRERIPLVTAAEEPEALTALPVREDSPRREARPRPRPRREPALPQRNLLEILLDPNSIQWLLVSGGVLLVLGLVIWLAAQGIFQNKLVLASLMGSANAAVLLGGWALVSGTRYQMTGRALALLACLFMPFNLWFYDAQGLVTLTEGGHLWIPALICCGLYAISARVLRDPIFVVVLVAGVTGAGLLLLADQDIQHFWEITAPATFLVTLGALCIHAERIFPPARPEGEVSPFSRKRFGLAFFFSGHAVLAAGLLLLFGAQLTGGWLFPLFKPLYALVGLNAAPEVVTTWNGKVTALVLVLVGTYAYGYSDVVVRRIGVYIYLAVFTLLWAEVLLIALFNWPLQTVEMVILALAGTALMANLILSQFTDRESPLVRVGPPLALALCAIPVVLGVFLHFWATALRGQPGAYVLDWNYVLVMVVTAISCRIGAFLHRTQRPGLATIYLFATAAATLVGAAGALLAYNPGLTWDQQAWLLMLIPLIYLVVARLYQSRQISAARPLAWVAHTATVLMLLSSVGASFSGFVLLQGQTLNLMLALFFAEALLFYLLDSAWSDHEASVYLATAMACASVWQLAKYWRAVDEYYTLIFAAVGLVLLVIYRFALLEEKVKKLTFTRAAFQAGNVLLSLSFLAAFLMTLGELLDKKAQRHTLVPLLLALLACGLAAIALVRDSAWRRWYIALAIGDVALTVLVLAVLGHLTPAQKLEIVCVVVGVVLLVVGHLGWYREQEQYSDLVSVGLFFGSVLVALPLLIAVYYCRLANRNFDTFHTANEVGMLTAGLILLATGFMCRIMATTLAGALLTTAYLVGLVLFLRVPERLQTTAVYIMVGGGVLFAAGLLLSLYRDRLLTLPDRIRRREGVFRVLTWR